MIIRIEDATNSAKPLYYQSLVLLYLPCEKFGADDIENSLYIKAFTQDGYHKVYVKLCVGDRSEELCDTKQVNTKQYADMKNFIGRTFVRCAEKIFGFVPTWGISTGVKPVKLARMFVKEFGRQEAIRILTQEYLIDEKKAKTAVDACISEDRLMSSLEENPCSLYISIPFCPTKCNYCSFVSCTTPRLLSLIPDYLVKLHKELQAVSGIIKEKGLKLQSIYVGGGTPAILDEKQIEALIGKVNELFDTKRCEFTFEAGRPDCITFDKLKVLKSGGVERISINTQTTNDEVLKSIGRNHTFSQYCRAMEYAEKLSFRCINTDLIAGLPGESCDSFCKSVDDVCDFNPQNITVHAFTLKKSSDYRTGGVRGFDESGSALKMTEYAFDALASKGYMPYYMYRQKNTVGNLENTGYCKSGFENLYNIIMMGEYHTVFGVGAGSVTKLVSRDLSKVERIFSPKYPYEFLDDSKYQGFDIDAVMSKL